MIDIRMIFNLIAKNLVKKYHIPGNYKVLPFMAANGGKICLYKQHHMTIKTYGHDSSWILDRIVILGANIIDCKLILGLL